MSKLIKDQSPFLHLLMSEKTPKPQTAAILKTISKDQLNALTEISYNLLKGHIPLSDTQKKSLKKHARKLKILSKPKGSLKSRKEILTPALVVLLLRIVGPVLKKVV